MGRALRFLGRALVRLTLGLAALAVVAVAGLAIAVRTDGGAAYLRGTLADVAADVTGARVHVGGLEARLLRGVTLRDVRLDFADGTRVRVPRVAVAWSLAALARGRILLGGVTAWSPRVRVPDPAATWAALTAERPDDGEASSAPPIALPDVQVHDGRIALRRDGRWQGLTDLEVGAAVTLAGGDLTLDLAHLRARPAGIDVSPIDVSGEVTVDADGRIALDAVRLATARSVIRADGRLVPDRSAALRARLAPLSARELRAVLPDVALAEDVRAAARVSGPWEALAVRLRAATPDAGSLAARGRVDARALAWEASATLAGLDPGGILPAFPPARLTGDIEAQGRGADAGATVDARLRLRDSRFADVALERLRLAAHLENGRASAQGTIAQPAGVARVRAAVVLADPPRWRARAAARVDDLAAIPGAPSGAGVVHLGARGVGVESATRQATASLRAAPLAVAGVRLERVTARAKLAGERLRLDAAEAQAPGFTAHAAGTLDLAGGRVDARLEAEGRLGALGAQRRVDGRATLFASAVGPLDALTVDASVSARDIRSDAVSARSLDATARLDGLGGAAPWARAWFAGSGIVEGGRPAWRGEGAAGWRRAGGEDRASVSVRATRADGAVVALAGDGAGSGPRFAGTISTMRLGLPDETPWSLAAPARWRFADRVLSTEGLTLAAGDQRVAFEGRVGVPGRNAARLTIAGLDLAPICRQLGQRTCGGRLVGTLQLAGTAAAPTVDGTLRADGVRVERETYGDVRVDLRYAAASFDARAQLVRAGAGRLDATATIPVDLAWDGPSRDVGGRPVQLGLRTDGLDLGFVPLLAPRTVRRLDGRLTADLRLAGPWGDLRGSGTAALSASALTLAATGVTYQGVEARVRLDGDTVLIERLDAQAGGGTLRASGRLGLHEGAPVGVTATLRFDRFLAVDVPAYRAEVSGDLRLTGSVPAPVIEGDVAVVEAVVRPGILPTSAPSLEPDPTIEVVGLPPAETAPLPPGPNLLDAVALDVRVRIERDAWIRRDDADIELAGELRITKAPQGPTLIRGRIRLVRGSYAFQGRRFTLDRGVVVFDGESPPDPALEVEATHVAGEYRVQVILGGTATHPTLTLTSEPPLDQADILAVLLFGRPARDLGRDQSVDLQRQAVALAAGYVAPELRSSVMDVFGLDTLDLGATEVSAGRYLTQDIFLSISAEFGAQPAQIVGVEYQLLPRVSVKMSTSSRGSSAIDLLWRRRY